MDKGRCKGRMKREMFWMGVRISRRKVGENFFCEV
jgi:hypothetical protein